LEGVTTTAHLRHPLTEFKTGLTRGGIVGHVTVSTGGCIFFSLDKGFRVRSLQITLVGPGMALFTFLVIEKECGCLTEKLRIRVFDTFFFDVGVAH